MPNIASVLKEEIARLARKEVRQEIEALKKAVSSHRGQIAELRRQVQEQERTIRGLRKAAAKTASSAAAEEPSSGRQLRFSPGRLAAQRKRLGLSAALFGQLIGTSGQTIYLWEQGKMRPSADNLAAIAALRKVGKRELAARLQALG